MEFVKNIIQVPFDTTVSLFKNLSLNKPKENPYIYLLYCEKASNAGNITNFLLNIYDDEKLAELQKKKLNDKYYVDNDNDNDNNNNNNKANRTLHGNKYFYYIVKKKCNEELDNAFIPLENKFYADISKTFV